MNLKFFQSSYAMRSWFATSVMINNEFSKSILASFSMLVLLIFSSIFSK
ncbi:hypothetical protein NPX79_01995 [Spiroplasma endosymbiont of Anurida maritima]